MAAARDVVSVFAKVLDTLHLGSKRDTHETTTVSTQPSITSHTAPRFSAHTTHTAHSQTTALPVIGAMSASESRDLNRDKSISTKEHFAAGSSHSVDASLAAELITEVSMQDAWDCMMSFDKLPSAAPWDDQTSYLVQCSQTLPLVIRWGSLEVKCVDDNPCVQLLLEQAGRTMCFRELANSLGYSQGWLASFRRPFEDRFQQVFDCIIASRRCISYPDALQSISFAELIKQYKCEFGSKVVYSTSDEVSIIEKYSVGSASTRENLDKFVGQYTSLWQLAEHFRCTPVFQRYYELDALRPTASVHRFNCKAYYSTHSSRLIGVIKGPQGSPYHGGVFKLELILSATIVTAKFTPPIYHCNVNEQTGLVAFPKSMLGMSSMDVLCEICDLLVNPVATYEQNDAAVQLFSADRVKYDALAREAAKKFWLGALDVDIKSIPGFLELFMPPAVMSGSAQLAIFEKVALNEQTKASSVAAEWPVNVHIQTLELQNMAMRIRVNDAERAVKELEGSLKQALYQLTVYTKYEKPQFEAKMQNLEQELARCYLRERTEEAGGAIISPILPASRRSTECMKEMILEAKAENTKLSHVMTCSFRKYEALFARFDQLKRIEEQKCDVVQAVDCSVSFFVAQAKHLEPDFRAILSGLVGKFNRNELPASLVTTDMPFSFSELRLISGHHAQALFAPQKSVKRLQEKIEEEHGKARDVLDYLRATIVMADPALLAMFFRALQRDTRFIIKRVKNKLLLKDLNQPPNVHINLEFCGHVGEIQLILEDFYLIKEHSHKPFEITRIGIVKDALVQGEELKKVVESVVSNGIYVLHPGKQEYLL